MLRIAITPRLVQIKDDYYGIQSKYAEAIYRNGAYPAMLPLIFPALNDIVKNFDGLLVTGGVDIDPCLYNEERKFGTTSHDFAYDVYDLALIRAFRRIKKPIFGICRGLQAINIALGGNVYQDIDTFYRNLNGLHKKTDSDPSFRHRVTISPASYLYQSIGSTECSVNSYHHQAIERLAPAIKVTARASDGIIEAIEGAGFVAVQWHPEKIITEKGQNDLFVSFLKQCALYRQSNR